MSVVVYPVPPELLAVVDELYNAVRHRSKERGVVVTRERSAFFYTWIDGTDSEVHIPSRADTVLQAHTHPETLYREGNGLNPPTGMDIQMFMQDWLLYGDQQAQEWVACAAGLWHIRGLTPLTKERLLASYHANDDDLEGTIGEGRFVGEAMDKVAALGLALLHDDVSLQQYKHAMASHDPGANDAALQLEFVPWQQVWLQNIAPLATL